MYYKTLKEEDIKNIGYGYVYEHLNTGCKVVHIKNNDKNKTFSITFKTPSDSSTGVQHIIEHCVLCGSKKYKLKEPFNIMDKSTINTYLNAMTFSDKTMYPISSTNSKDFFKLLDVYLDAVFFPLIYEKEGIFLQEGWHFNGEEINGIVFNEMKGVYSDPEALIEYKVRKALFEKTCYSNESGGIPSEIVNLTYEEFLAYHKKYYNPTNSIIYFYGDLDIDFYLNYIHEEYLSKFERGTEALIQSTYAKPEKSTICESYYLEKDEFEADNYLQAAFRLKFSLEAEKAIAFQAISSFLTENQDAFLKNIFIKEKIGSNIVSYLDDDMLDPMFSIKVEGTDFSDVEHFKNTILSAIKNIEFNQDIIKSNIAPIEFYLKEGEFGSESKGIFYNILLLKEMLYGKFEFDILHFDQVLQKARNLDFENLLKENILENENSVYAILTPSTCEIKENDLGLNKNDKKLLSYQLEEDKEEELNKLAPIAFSEVGKEVFHANTETQEVNGVNITFNSINSEIVYLDFVFDVSELGENYYLSLFAYLLDKLGTEKLNISELDTKMNYIFGNYSASIKCYDLESGDFIPSLTISFRLLEKNLKEGFFLINDLFNNLLLTDKNRLKIVLNELYERLKLSIFKETRVYLETRCKSYLNYKFQFQESMNGISFYYWFQDLVQNLDLNIEKIIQNLDFIKKDIFCIKDLNLFLTSSPSNFKEVSNLLKNLEFGIKNRNYLKAHKFNINKDFNEAFVSNLDINYNFCVSNLKEVGYLHKGYVYVLKKIIESDYIWTKIRLEGGAYGGAISIDRKGILTLNSYSDPNVFQTYQTFKNISSYIQTLNLDKNSIHTYIIGAVNMFDYVVKHSDINKISIYRKFFNLSTEDFIKEKEEILNTSLHDLKEFFQIFDYGIKNAKICTIGNKKSINSSKNIFNIVKTF